MKKIILWVIAIGLGYLGIVFLVATAFKNMAKDIDIEPVPEEKKMEFIIPYVEEGDQLLVYKVSNDTTYITHALYSDKLIKIYNPGCLHYDCDGRSYVWMSIVEDELLVYVEDTDLEIKKFKDEIDVINFTAKLLNSLAEGNRFHKD